MNPVFLIHSLQNRIDDLAAQRSNDAAPIDHLSTQITAIVGRRKQDAEAPFAKSGFFPDGEVNSMRRASPLPGPSPDGWGSPQKLQAKHEDDPWGVRCGWVPTPDVASPVRDWEPVIPDDDFVSDSGEVHSSFSHAPHQREINERLIASLEAASVSAQMAAAELAEARRACGDRAKADLREMIRVELDTIKQLALSMSEHHRGEMKKSVL